MANRAYLNIWSKGFTEATMLEQFQQLLETVPFSTERPGFAELVIHAVDPTETSLVERDLRSHHVGVAELIEMAREYLHADSAYEVKTHWDLWVFEKDVACWQQKPQRLEIACNGEEYDDGAFTEFGHFQADLGFEHFFTGHGGLLGSHGPGIKAPQEASEAEFLNLMAQPENLSEYHQRTRENIEKLMRWIGAIEKAIPVERYRLWSEGEENFEARLDGILAAR